jgi:primosomal protein N' (replication factor Y)
MVDVPLPHLDRPFDYLVPDHLDDDIQAGSRVRVRFAGRLVDAYVLERAEQSEHRGQLTYIERAVGAEPVLTAETARFFRAVADRWAGMFVDVVRLGVPARHARAETSHADASAPRLPLAPDRPAGLAAYRHGAAFLAAIADGRPARAVWSALPGEPWAQRVAEAVHSVLLAGRGSVVVVPDTRDLDDLDAALIARLGEGHHVALAAELGPAQRYRRWLAVRRGDVRVVIGTRSATYAPVSDPGLFALWDDGDDLHAEPRAPYPHVRDVLALRSALTGAALLLAGHARTAEAQLLVETGWAHEIVAARATVRAAAPRVQSMGDDVELARDPAAAAARLPTLAWRTARQALAAGHAVLVQVPRAGYVPALACARDHTPARCAVCGGPLAQQGRPGADTVPACRWCGRPAGTWTCPACGGRRMRAVVVGAQRTAEELGRAFPGAAIRQSGRDHVLAAVRDEAALVVATPGAEPACDGGYGAALLLDGWALLSRPDLRAAEEALRRWTNAAALVRAGAPVIVGADPGVPAVQALIRWDAAGFAARELTERAELGFPPASRMATITGGRAGVAEIVDGARLPAGAQVNGPVPVDADTERVLIRVRRADGLELAHALKTAAALRSARRATDPVRIVLDPAALT